MSCVSRVTPRYRAVSTHLLAPQKTVLAWALHSSPGLNLESHSALRDVDGYIPARRSEQGKKDKWFWHIERKGQERISDWNNRRRRVLAWLTVHSEDGRIMFPRLVVPGLQTTRHNVLQDGNAHKHGVENLKSYELVTCMFYNGIASDSYREIVSNRIERERYREVFVS